MDIQVPVWSEAEVIGYEPKTTFWQDFSIAEAFGERAVQDTFRRAFNAWKESYEYLTELALVVNHKAWEWNNRDEAMCRLYCRFYDRVDVFARRHLKGEALDYYLETVD